MAVAGIVIRLDSEQVVELINSFNSKIEKLEANIGIKDDQIELLQGRVSEIESFLHI